MESWTCWWQDARAKAVTRWLMVKSFDATAPSDAVASNNFMQLVCIYTATFRDEGGVGGKWCWQPRVMWSHGLICSLQTEQRPWQQMTRHHLSAYCEVSIDLCCNDNVIETWVLASCWWYCFKLGTEITWQRTIELLFTFAECLLCNFVSSRV